MMKKYLKNIFYGFLAWLIPFAASFFFYSKKGLMIDIHFFKTIMIVVGSISGAILLVSYFKAIKTDYLKEGVSVGVVWFGMNILMDLLVLLPMSRMSISVYFAQIGLRYLVIPAISISIGMSLANRG